MADAFAFAVLKVETLASGGCKLTLVANDSEDDIRKAMSAFAIKGTPVAVAVLRDGYVTQAEPPKVSYGDAARALKLSSFFRTEAVWRACGTDAEFLSWVRQQKCCVCGREPPSEAAHVRRVASGAGTGIKPAYSAVGLCTDCHRLQHQGGESALFPHAGTLLQNQSAKEWFDRQRIEHVSRWAWEALRAHLGHESMSTVPPTEVRAWAELREVNQYLPAEYQ